MRPTTSKVKLAIVSMLGRDLVKGSKVLDLFAGTGSVGIELFKLGAKKVVMIDCLNHIKVLSGSQFGIYQNLLQVCQLDFYLILALLMLNGLF